MITSIIGRYLWPYLPPATHTTHTHRTDHHTHIDTSAAQKHQAQKSADIYGTPQTIPRPTKEPLGRQVPPCGYRDTQLALQVLVLGGRSLRKSNLGPM
mmetsp:Transcript_25344/g.73182  ORF Transcript_25344/g.73182 Transcript_25344/m.73182 type:complete len:98 (+) Transcript_25344:288-581(+)